NNTGDACALYDTNADGKVDRAVCVTIVAPDVMQAGNPKCYTCNNSKAQNCAGSTPVACTSTCSVGSGVDPFAGDPAHTSQKCTGTGCRTSDTETTCCVA